MKRYVTYISGRILGALTLIALSLTGIIWLSQSLRFVDLIINRGLNVTMFLYLSSLLLPSLLSVVLPLSFFIAVLFVYNKLMMESELVVLKSAGLSKLSLIKPVLVVALLMTVLSYGITLYLLPTSYREFKDLQSFIRNNYVSVLLQEGVFNSPTKGLTVYIRQIEDTGQLHGIIVHDSRVVGKPVTMMAESGKLVRTSTGPRFVLINGNRQEVSHETQQLSLLQFDRYALDLSTFTQAQERRWREPEERYVHELFSPDAYTQEVAAHLIQKMKAEGHHRITWPLYNILLALIALMAFISGTFNRRGQTWKILVYSVVGLAMMGVGLTMNNVVANNPNMVGVMYGVVLGGIIAVLYVLVHSPHGHVDDAQHST